MRVLVITIVSAIFVNFVYGQNDLDRPIYNPQRQIIKTYANQFENEIKEINALYNFGLICLEQKKARYLEASAFFIARLEEAQFDLSANRPLNSVLVRNRIIYIYRPQ